ncbi:HAMP domain-containing histidine kinase [Curtobacterium flaccumfaciens pv. flaccumfaciens]|uniref:sensor histidine kinase n=1 Tax=Curtobacterium flaccumfaciens TaxID=2035 RepID=UPI00217D481E|nr:HAMP domain-containing sensor histidine kinase [Curtobacterium flaccumfaciens]MCS6549164.1 HAMP domain-containing histidine kinase [Curtobacterium flaccumfaciens pv. flaccumfaciens]
MALLLVATNVVVGAVTVVAFRGYLVDRLDAELSTAAMRTVGGRDGAEPPPGASGPPPGSSSPSSGSGSGSSSSSSSSSSDDLPDPDNAFIGAPGQSAGTVIAIVRDGDVVLGGYTDGDGDQRRLTAAQQRTLAAVQAGGGPVTVELGTLGDYRVQAVGDDGDVFVTALPLGDLDAAIARLLLVIGVVTVLGLAVAAWALTVLVRRSLRPLERVAAVASGVTALDLERGDPDIPVRVSDADLRANREVAQVGGALNRLLGHVARALTVRRDAEAGMRTFVADASHELRTPIATVRAYAELSERTSDLDAVHRNVERIGREAVRMGDLVDELLLLARLDASALASGAPASQVVREPVDLTSLVVEATVDARATAPDHRWTLQVVDDQPVLVAGDEVQLRRVVTNLLTNARTHTAPGTAVVVSLQLVAGSGSASASASASDGAVVRFVVANDGPPIPAESLPTLFDRFTRGEASRSREHGTSGLGLAIVRAVVVAHGGSVRVASEPGRTAFTVDLPASGAS